MLYTRFVKAKDERSTVVHKPGSKGWKEALGSSSRQADTYRISRKLLPEPCMTGGEFQKLRVQRQDPSSRSSRAIPYWATGTVRWEHGSRDRSSWGASKTALIDCLALSRPYRAPHCRWVPRARCNSLWSLDPLRLCLCDGQVSQIEIGSFVYSFLQRIVYGLPDTLPAALHRVWAGRLSSSREAPKTNTWEYQHLHLLIHLFDFSLGSSKP